VPFQGGAPALTAVLSNNVDLLSTSMPPVVAHVKKGSLKVLGVSSLTRVSALPEVPTLAEAGYPEFEERSWVGFFAPAKTPREIVERLNGDINAVTAAADIRERFASLGMDPHPGSAADFAAYVRKEVSKWAAIVKATGVAQVE
jgi:tripartite-type tricarboxylate transporter receptor subunit TctC